MTLYLDSSALVKRYVSESGSDEIRGAMEGARWLTSRITYVETSRAVELGSYSEDGARAAFSSDWSSFDVVEVTAPVAEQAARLAVPAGLRSLDAIHLASALFTGSDDLVFATWDERLHAAAAQHGLAVLPKRT